MAFSTEPPRLLSDLQPIAWIWLQRLAHLSWYLHHHHLGPLLRAFPGRSYLEVGCGPGTFVRFLETQVVFDRYVGVDMDQSRIRHARRSYADEPRISFEVSRVEDLEITETYDCVVIIGLLHHLDSPTCAKLLESIRPRVRQHVFVLEPVFDRETRLARTYRRYFERGAYLRKHRELLSLLHELEIHEERCTLQPLHLFDFVSIAASFPDPEDSGMLERSFS